MIKDYYRLTKPGIVYSNVMTAAAGYLFASKWHINWITFLALIVGTALIIASACVFNNYIDRGIDAKMARTKIRAIPAGKISVRAAILYGCILGVLGFLILAKTNRLTFLLGVGAFFSYVILYGYAKRKSVHGTLIGTLPGAASLVAGYTAQSNQLDGAALWLFIIMAAWQMAHFYAIAIFRHDDYKAADIPVNSVVRGMKNTKIQIIFYVVLFILACSALSVFGYAGLTFRVVMLIVGIYWLWAAFKNYQKKDGAKWARQMFGISLLVLLIFSVVVSLGAVLP